MSISTDVFRTGVDLDTTERATRAIKAFRSMQPTLTSYARILTKKPTMRVEMAAKDNGSTDGNKIFYRPPIALGDKTEHERRYCDKRDADKQLICLACAVREDVLATIYHEIAHNCFDSFEETSEEDKANLVANAIKEVGGKYAEEIAAKISATPAYVKSSYISMASLVSPFLPIIVNALEDARVNRELFAARKGTKVMFVAKVHRIFNNGVEQKDPEGNLIVKRWDTYPLNQQVTVGIFVKASGYSYKDWFVPEVVDALDDPELTQLVNQMSTVRSAGAVYHLSFPILARLRELGYCKSDIDPEEEESQEEEDTDEEDGDESDEEPSTEGDPCPDGEPGGDSDDADSGSDPNGGEGEPSDGGGAGGQEDSGTSDEPQESESEGSGAEGESNSEEDSGSGDSDDSGPGAGDSSEDSEPDGDTSEGGSSGGSTDNQGGSSEEEDTTGSSDEPDAERSGTTGTGDINEGTSGSSQVDPSADVSDDADGSHGQDSDGDDADRQDDGRRSGDAGSDDGLDEGDSSRGPSESDDNDVRDSDGRDDAGLDVADSDDSEAGSREGDSHLEPVSTSSEGDDWQPPSDEYSPEDNVDQDDDVIDTGADTGEGGVEIIENSANDRLPMGTAEDCKTGLLIIGDHEDKPKTIEEGVGESAVDRALIQGIYFETPSQEIFGVREHTYGQPIMYDRWNMSRAWDNHAWASNLSVGKDGNFVTPEKILGPALVRMRVAFADNQRGKESRGRRSGKVDARVLGKRAPANDERLFKKKTLPGKKDYFVVISMDISGSTIGENIKLEKQAVAAQASLLTRMGIPFEIFAHSANYHDPSFGRAKGLDLDIYLIKLANEPWDKNTRVRLDTLGPDSANLDGHALEYMRKRLDKVTATNKIVMYYSDGKMPAENADEELIILQREIKTCKKKGYTLMGVGIRTDSPRAHGLDTVQVDTEEDVLKVVKHLEKRLLA